jgi:WD40 repeat protein
VWVYDAASLALLATLPARAELDHTALALSRDGELLAVASAAPGAALSVWQWKKGLLLATVPLEDSSVTQVSFCPADPGRLLTTELSNSVGGGSSSGAGDGDASDSYRRATSARVWALEQLSSGHHLAPSAPLALGGGRRASCGAWAPEGVYVGCTSGEVVLVDPDSRQLLSSLSSETADGGAEPAAAEDSSGDGGVSCIAVNADAVVVCSGTSDPMRWLSRGGAGAKQLRPLGQVPGTNGAVWAELGGPLHRDALVSTRDGCLLMVSQLPPPPSKQGAAGGAAAPAVEPLADCHAGAITGLAALPGGAGKLLSAGEDGSLRVWDAEAGGQLAGRRDFAGARLTAVAAASGRRALAAVGSGSGVLRVVSTAEHRSLPVLWRGRLGRGPLTALALSTDDGLLAAVCSCGGGAGGLQQQEDCLALLSLGGPSGTTVKLLGYATCGGKVASIAWVPGGGCASDTGSGSQQLLVALQSGALMSLHVSPGLSAAVDDGKSQEGLEATCCDNDGMSGMQLQLEDLKAGVVALEPPICRLVAGCSRAGKQKTAAVWVLGQSATDGQLHRFVLPADASGWAAAGSSKPLPTVRAAESVTLHGKAATALALSPCGGVLASCGGDGSVAVREVDDLASTSLAAVAAAAAAVASGETALRPHGKAVAARLSFDASGGWLATAGEDGSLFVHKVEGAASATAALAAADPLPAEQEVGIAYAPDDAAEPLLPQLLAAAARADKERRDSEAHAATRRRLEDLKRRLAALLARNAAAPEGQRLSAEEVIVDVGRLRQLRAAAESEAERLKVELSEAAARDEIVAARIKEEVWDGLEVKPAAVTGMVSRQEVWNMPLERDDGRRYREVAALRGVELLDWAASGRPTVGQLLRKPSQSAASAAAAAAAPSVGAAGASAGALGGDAAGSKAAAAGGSSGAVEPIAGTGQTAAADATLQRQAQQSGFGGEGPVPRELVEALAAGRPVSPDKLLYDDLEVTTPMRKVTQAELLKRMVRDAKER